LRAIDPVNHGGNGTPRFAGLMIDEAPTTSRVLSWRLPCLEIDSSFSFPPLEIRRGVRPSQAAKSRPVCSSRCSRDLSIDCGPYRCLVRGAIVLRLPILHQEVAHRRQIGARTVDLASTLGVGHQHIDARATHDRRDGW
jgi:hypothetical protein